MMLQSPLGILLVSTYKLLNKSLQCYHMTLLKISAAWLAMILVAIWLHQEYKLYLCRECYLMTTRGNVHNSDLVH